ncbi:MAG: hypothetical protein ACTSW1_05940 [Candidatus Hodarchaeales archaeon]
MILNALIQIGRSLPRKEKDFDLDEEIINYIDLKYPNPPKIKYIIRIIIKPEMIDFLKGLERKIEQTELQDIKYGKINKKELDLFVQKIISQVKPDFERLKNCLDTEKHDYKKEHDYMMLRGNKGGTSIFLSPTLYETINSKTGLTKFQLWKISLDLEGTLEENKLTEEENLILEFFKYVPSLTKSTMIKENDPKSIVRFIMTAVLAKVLNEIITDKYDCKKGSYYMPFCFNGKWPYEFSLLREYYKKKISSDSKNKQGVCEGCGRLTDTSDGLTGELGFYTVDQKGFAYSFQTNDKYQLCDDCKKNVEKGFSYVKEHQTVYLGDRGKNENPYMLYVIPVVENPDDLPVVLKKVDLARKESKLQKIREAGAVATKAKKSKEGKKKTTKDSKMDFFEMLPVRVGKTEPPFSLLLVVFYHPKGQSSAFHNIISIDFLDYTRIIRLSQQLSKLNLDWGEQLTLKDIYFIFGQHKFRKYITSLLNLKQMDLRQLCKDAYLNLKVDFFRQVAKPEESSNYIGLNLKRLNSFIRLSRSLNLL